MAAYFKADVARIKARLEEPQAPRLVLLEGPLGAGKTTFVQELLSSWGWPSNEVQSPTFLKLLEHRIPHFGLVLHIDAYRIDDEDVGVERLALESYDDIRLCVVEWSAPVLAYLKARPALARALGLTQALRVEFKMGANALAPRTLVVEELTL
jgi:tRNA threonylcarbamoyl adenosine modification protein YjeE